MSIFGAWAREAKNFGSPILIEWGTEPNGNWFSWNGRWMAAPTKVRDATLPLIGTLSIFIREQGADNLQMGLARELARSTGAKMEPF